MADTEANMFGRKQSTEASVVQAIPQLVAPVGREVTTIPLEDNERIAYERTCKAIDFEPAALLQARILSFFKVKGIRIFNYDEVAAYMKRKAQAQLKQWHWRPLREVDIIRNWRWGFPEGWSHPGSSHGYYSAEFSQCRPYHHEVPLRVLGTVEKIYQEFGDRVKFFVTDYTSLRPDPFIAAVAFEAQAPFLVFDFWDEPDFGASLAP